MAWTESSAWGVYAPRGRERVNYEFSRLNFEHKDNKNEERILITFSAARAATPSMDYLMYSRPYMRTYFHRLAADDGEWWW